MTYERCGEPSLEPALEVVDERTGYVYVSSNGQLVVDQHGSDEAHLVSPATRLTQPLYDCRLYLKDVIPKEWIGLHGKLTVRVERGAKEWVSLVSIAFEPS